MGRILQKHQDILRTIAQEERIRSALESKDIKNLSLYTGEDTQGGILFELQFILNSLKDGCRDCSNCCETCDIDLNFYDVERLAAYLKLSPGEFISRFCVKSPIDALCFFRLKARPCVFLKDNRCTVYQYRPTKCVLYPFISDIQEENYRKYGAEKIVITVPTWCNAGDKAIELSKKLKRQPKNPADNT